MSRRQKGRGPFRERTRQTGKSQRGGKKQRGGINKRYNRRGNHMFKRPPTDIIYYR